VARCAFASATGLGWRDAAKAGLFLIVVRPSAFVAVGFLPAVPIDVTRTIPALGAHAVTPLCYLVALREDIQSALGDPVVRLGHVAFYNPIPLGKRKQRPFVKVAVKARIKQQKRAILFERIAQPPQNALHRVSDVLFAALFAFAEANVILAVAGTHSRRVDVRWVRAAVDPAVGALGGHY